MKEVLEKNGEQIGQPLKWDPVKETFDNSSANELKSYRYRGDWTVDS